MRRSVVAAAQPGAEEIELDDPRLRDGGERVLFADVAHVSPAQMQAIRRVRTVAAAIDVAAHHLELLGVAKPIIEVLRQLEPTGTFS